MPNQRELIFVVVPPEINPNLSGNFSFTVLVNSVNNKPSVMVLEGAAGSTADFLVSAEAICQTRFRFPRAATTLMFDRRSESFDFQPSDHTTALWD
jgi:hypothetical protein